MFSHLECVFCRQHYLMNVEIVMSIQFLFIKYSFENGTVEISKFIQYVKSNYSHKFEDILLLML